MGIYIRVFKHCCAWKVLLYSCCYSQILCGGSTKNFRLCLLCIDLVANWQKTSNPEAELQEHVYLDRTDNWLINYWIRYNFQHRSQWFKQQISNTCYCAQLDNTKLEYSKKFLFKILTWISTYWWHRKMMLKSGNRPLHSRF